MVICKREKMWSYSTGDAIASSPAIDATGNIFIGVDNGYLYKVNGVSGTLMWRYLTSSSVRSSPAIDAEGNVYVGSYDTYLYKVNGAHGTLMWRYKTGYAIESSPAIDAAGDLLINSNDGYLYNINGASGRLMWRSRTGSSVSPALDAVGNVYTISNHILYKINGTGGIRMWRYMTTGAFTSPVIDASGNVFVAAGDYAFKINGTSGVVMWAYECSAWVDLYAIDSHGRMLLSCFDTLHSVEGASGELIWSYTVPKGLLSSSYPAIDASGNVFVDAGALYKLSRTCYVEDISTCPSRFQWYVHDEPYVVIGIAVGFVFFFIMAMYSLFDWANKMEASTGLVVVASLIGGIDLLGDILYLLTQDFYVDSLFYVSTGLLIVPFFVFAVTTWRVWTLLIYQHIVRTRRALSFRGFDLGSAGLQVRCSFFLFSALVFFWNWRGLKEPAYEELDTFVKVIHTFLVSVVNPVVPFLQMFVLTPILPVLLPVSLALGVVFYVFCMVIDTASILFFPSALVLAFYTKFIHMAVRVVDTKPPNIHNTRISFLERFCGEAGRFCEKMF